jgi:shikimate 5-dehydrogenase
MLKRRPLIKLALIGDTDIRHYTVADRLWELLAVVSDVRLNFDVVPLATADDVIAFFEKFKKDSTFKGFNIAVSWKKTLAAHMGNLEELSVLPVLNTVYKDTGGRVVGTNTDPLAAQKAVEARANLYTCKSVLVIGDEGTGLPIAYHYAARLGKKVFLFDCHEARVPKQVPVRRLASLADVLGHQYDLIVNATPLGRYYFDGRIEAFSSPLDLTILEQITHSGSIVQETNYLPGNTLMLQMAQGLGLQTVSGDLMMVFRAAESMQRFCGKSLSKDEVDMLVNEIRLYITEREDLIMQQSRHSSII